MAVFVGKIETEFRIIEKHIRRTSDPIVGYLINMDVIGKCVHGPFKTKEKAEDNLRFLMRSQMKEGYKRVRGDDLTLRKELSEDELDDDVVEDKICYVFEEVVLSKKK